MVIFCLKCIQTVPVQYFTLITVQCFAAKKYIQIDHHSTHSPNVKFDTKTK